MAFVSLMKYADKAEEAAEPVVTGVCEISVNTGIVKRQLRHTWKTMINAGYARDSSKCIHAESKSWISRNR